MRDRFKYFVIRYSNDYKNNIENKGINDNRLLNNETDKKHYIINVDRQRITQVVTNLLNNAVKLTEDDKGGGVDI